MNLQIVSRPSVRKRRSNRLFERHSLNEELVFKLQMSDLYAIQLLICILQLREVDLSVFIRDERDLKSYTLLFFGLARRSQRR